MIIQDSLDSALAMSTPGAPALPSRLESLAQAAQDFAIAALLLALVTALIVQALYDVGLRSRLQRGLVRRWVYNRLRWMAHGAPSVFDSLLASYKLSRPADASEKRAVGVRRLVEQLSPRISTELEGKAAGGGLQSVENLYSLPYRQLCGQFSRVVHSEVDLLDSLLLRVFGVGPEGKDPFLSLTQAKEKNEQSTSAPARAQVLLWVERGLDDLQLYLGRWLTLAGYFISTAVPLGLVSALAYSISASTGDLITVVMLSCVSALLSPIIRAALDRVAPSR